MARRLKWQQVKIMLVNIKDEESCLVEGGDLLGLIGLELVNPDSADG